MTGNRCVFTFPRRSVDEKHLMRFQSVTASVFKFFWRYVDGPSYEQSSKVIVWNLVTCSSQLGKKSTFFSSGQT